jgi:hypothetical protein
MSKTFPLSLKEWWSYPQSKITLFVVLSVFIIAMLSKWTASDSSIETKYSKRFMKQMNRVVQQASKWHTTSKQDSDPLMHLIHSNYALAYAQTARALAPDTAIEKVTGIRLAELLYHLEDDQNNALQALVNACPNIKPTGVYTTGSAWM